MPIHNESDAECAKSVVNTHNGDHVGERGFVFRMINLAGVTIPIIGLITAIILLWGVAFNGVHLAILAGMYIATALGITVGYHRFFTHRSFKTPRFMEVILVILGSMAVEGSVMQWVAVHRRHHQHSDHDDDPHSPHTHGGGVWGMILGMWHAHMGWIVGARAPGLERYAQDLRKDRLIVCLSRLFPVWVLLGLLIPALLGGLITMTWTGALLGFLWGGLVRVFCVHHVTWSINSVCHIWGTKPFKSRDESRNNAIFGVLAMGEGWHNNHHAFPTSARHGLRWWQIDFSYWVIWAMSKIGLAKDIRIPSAARIAAKRA